MNKLTAENIRSLQLRLKTGMDNGTHVGLKDVFEAFLNMLLAEYEDRENKIRDRYNRIDPDGKVVVRSDKSGSPDLSARPTLRAVNAEIADEVTRADKHEEAAEAAKVEKAANTADGRPLSPAESEIKAAKSQAKPDVRPRK